MYICILCIQIHKCFVSCTHITYFFFFCFPPYTYRLVYYSLYI